MGSAIRGLRAKDDEAQLKLRLTDALADYSRPLTHAEIERFLTELHDPIESWQTPSRRISKWAEANREHCGGV